MSDLYVNKAGYQIDEIEPYAPNSLFGDESWDELPKGEPGQILQADSTGKLQMVDPDFVTNTQVEGGSTGQVLAKASDTDGDFTWVNQGGSGSLPSGTEGQILMVDDNAEWQAVDPPFASDSDVAAVRITAEAAQTAATSASADAATAIADATVAKDRATNAITSAGNAQTTANSAVSAAANAQTTADSALSKATSNEAVIEQHTTEISDNAGKTAELDADLTLFKKGFEGGSTDQVLAKKSGSDYDFKWVNQSGGGGSDVPTGTEGQILMADENSEWQAVDPPFATTNALDAVNATATSAGSAAATAQTTAEAAQTTADNAQTAAESAQTRADSAYTLATTANENATTAQNTANSASSAAANAQSTADDATTAAGNAQTTATNAATTANTAQETATSASTAAATAQAAAEAAQADVDNLETILAGGTSGQVLSKASDTDLDFTWITASGGSGGSSITELTPEMAVMIGCNFAWFPSLNLTTQLTTDLTNIKGYVHDIQGSTHPYSILQLREISPIFQHAYWGSMFGTYIGGVSRTNQGVSAANQKMYFTVPLVVRFYEPYYGYKIIPATVEYRLNYVATSGFSVEYEGITELTTASTGVKKATYISILGKSNYDIDLTGARFFRFVLPSST